MNNIVLMGRLTAEPELKVTANGVECVSMSIAVDRQFKNANGEKITDFIPIKAWRKTAVFISQYFKKGQMICLQGNMNVDKYVDNDGNNKTFTYVTANNVEFCGGKNESTAPGIVMPKTIDEALEEITTDEDLPF